MVQPLFLNVVVSINYIFTCLYVLYYIFLKCLWILRFMIQTIHDLKYNLSDSRFNYHAPV